MTCLCDRRQFLRAGAIAASVLGLSEALPAAFGKSVLVFTKSSGWEHDVVKRSGSSPSVVESAVASLGQQHGFDVATSKDGSIFSSGEFRKYSAVLFFTTGDLTTPGTDKNPPMTPEGKQALLDAVRAGLGFVGVHAASDTFHTPPDTEDNANRYIAHGEKSDPYLRMVGGEFITHGSNPRLQEGSLIVNDAKFPGLEGVASPLRFTEEWYSMKDFMPDLHVILTLDTQGMKGEPYQRARYPVTWVRMHGKGRVFYTAMGDRPENWQSPFFLNLLTGGIRWATGDANASASPNLKEAAPGFAEIPPRPRKP